MGWSSAASSPATRPRMATCSPTRSGSSATAAASRSAWRCCDRPVSPRLVYTRRRLRADSEPDARRADRPALRQDAETHARPGAAVAPVAGAAPARTPEPPRLNSKAARTCGARRAALPGSAGVQRPAEPAPQTSTLRHAHRLLWRHRVRLVGKAHAIPELAIHARRRPRQVRLPTGQALAETPLRNLPRFHARVAG